MADGIHISESVLNSAVLIIVGAVVTALMTWLWRSRDAEREKAKALAISHQAVLDRLAELEKREAVAAAAMTPLLTAVQAIFVQKLTHLHKPELDALLVKIGPPDVLSAAERERLMVMLHDRSWDADETVGDDERSAAKILPLLMPMVLDEQARIKEVEGHKSFKLMTVLSVFGAEAAVEDRILPASVFESLEKTEGAVPVAPPRP